MVDWNILGLPPKINSPVLPFNRISSTGLASDGWTEWISEQAYKLGYRDYFEIHDNPKVGFDWYAIDALKYGFGYTPAKHMTFYYRMLKERTISNVLREYKKHRYDNILFISGVYRDESIARANVPEVQKFGSAVWVNPLLYWTKEEVQCYRIDNSLPTNPFYNTTGGSGDCNCNWGQFISLPKFVEHSPILGNKLALLNADVRKIHGYGWGEKPSASLLAENRGQLTLPGIEPLITSPLSPTLCAGCSSPKPKQKESIDNYMTDRIKW